MSHPLCTQARRSRLYAVQSAIAMQIPELHVMGHAAKALPVYLMEEGWCQVLHLDKFSCIMHD